MAFPQIVQRLVDVVNCVLCTDIFPNLWKYAKVMSILKSSNHLRMETKSFRLVFVLLVLVRILGRVQYPRICENIFRFRNQNKRKGCYLGFLSWYDHQALIDWVSVIVFLDIFGVFDNLDWALLMEDLVALGATPTLYSVIYFFIIKS